jgi:hypothetical protein
MLAWMLERWVNWSDNHGNIENVFSKDDLLTHATIVWAGNAIDTSIRTYANNNRYPWMPSHDRWPVAEAPTGITFVATRTRQVSRQANSAYRTSSRVIAPPGTTTSTSPPTIVADTSSPGRYPTNGSTTCDGRFADDADPMPNVAILLRVPPRQNEA